MLDWLWKSRRRKPAHPPNSLAYFQVYGSGPEPPATDCPGPIWRYRVPYEVKLECHMLPVLDQPSFLTVPKRASIQVYPPLFQVSGQIEADQSEELPVDEWMAQGTLWWLKRLGAVQVAGLLAYMLLIGHDRLDRQRYPEIDGALSFLLADHRSVAPPRPPGVREEQKPPEPPPAPTPRVKPWAKFPVELTLGCARVQFLDRRDGKCCWRIGKRVFWAPLWEKVALSLLIEVEDWSGSDEQLLERVRADFLRQVPGLLPRLLRYPAANRRLRPLLQKLAAGG